MSDLEGPGPHITAANHSSHALTFPQAGKTNGANNPSAGHHSDRQCPLRPHSFGDCTCRKPEFGHGDDHTQSTGKEWFSHA